jgi:hypothetical protein
VPMSGLRHLGCNPALPGIGAARYIVFAAFN